MSSYLVDPGIVRRWIVCETDTRWLTALRRFAPQIMPPNLVPELHTAPRAHALSMLAHAKSTIILWEVRRDSIAVSCECLAHASMLAPNVMQIVAGSDLRFQERLAIAAYPVSATIRHPEDLVGLTRMIHRYFARSAQRLD